MVTSSSLNLSKVPGSEEWEVLMGEYITNKVFDISNFRVKQQQDDVRLSVRNTRWKFNIHYIYKVTSTDFEWIIFMLWG